MGKPPADQSNSRVSHEQNQWVGGGLMKIYGGRDMMMKLLSIRGHSTAKMSIIAYKS
jgi:hypothetical protein